MWRLCAQHILLDQILPFSARSFFILSADDNFLAFFFILVFFFIALVLALITFIALGLALVLALITFMAASIMEAGCQQLWLEPNRASLGIGIAAKAGLSHRRDKA
jgi:hypothetical protein